MLVAPLGRCALQHRAIFFPRQMCLRRPRRSCHSSKEGLVPSLPQDMGLLVPPTYLLSNVYGADLCCFACTGPLHMHPPKFSRDFTFGFRALLFSNLKISYLQKRSPMTGTCYLSCLWQKGQGLWELAGCMCCLDPLIQKVPIGWAP